MAVSDKKLRSRLSKKKLEKCTDLKVREESSLFISYNKSQWFLLRDSENHLLASRNLQ